MTDDTNLTTIPAFDADNHLSDEVRPGAEMLVGGERRTVAEVKTRAIVFEDDYRVRFVGVDYDDLEVIVDEDDEDDQDDDEEVTLALGGAEGEDYCRVTVDGERVAVTDVRRTADGVELIEDETTVMWLRVDGEAAEQIIAAVEQAIQDDVGGTVTVAGSLEATHNAYQPEVVCDGGQDRTAHFGDGEIAESIEHNDDPEHPEALTVERTREILASIQRSWEEVWDLHMESVEEGTLEVVADTGDVVVFADHLGTMWGDEFSHGELGDVPLDRTDQQVIKQVHHTAAARLTDYNWGTASPFVIRKPESAEAGQRYVEGVVNMLINEGLSPGQAWGVYGVHVAGNSRNLWASRLGYQSHSGVSNRVREAEEKAGHLGLLK